MNQDQLQVIYEAFNRYGLDKQTTKTIEELGELIVEVAKAKNGPVNRDGIKTEIADVLICLEYLKIIFAFEDEEIKEEVGRKLNRLNYRMSQERIK